MNAVISTLANPPLTNKHCADIVAAYVNKTAQLQLDFAAKMSQVLPIAAAAVQFTTPLKCVPVNPVATRPDQAAYFVTDISISGSYLFFAKDAPYVTYGSDNLDHSLQFPEETAALNMVRNTSMPSYCVSLI